MTHVKIVLAKDAGFCYGVDRAVDIAMRCIDNYDNVVCFGELVHNKDVMEGLTHKGLKVVQPEDLCEEDHLLIRAHGAPKEVMIQAEALGVNVTDATCPYVKRIHEIVSDMALRFNTVVIFGHKGHPEVKGIESYIKGSSLYVVNSVDELKRLPIQLTEVGLVSQTTANRQEWSKVVDYLTKIVVKLEVADTICDSTTLRQQATVDLASQADIMLIVGGHNSSNTTRLWELCYNLGVPAYHVENATELKLEWFKSLDSNNSDILIGISAGASTPDWIIKEVLMQMENIMDKKENNEEQVNMEETTVEEVEETVEEVEETTATEEEVEETEEVTENMEDMYEDDLTELKPRSIVSGKVVRVGDDEVFVDIGHKSEGIITLRELTNDSSLTPADIVSEGEDIEVYVLRASDENGNPVLSKRRVDSIKSWDKVNEAFDADENITGEVIEVVKGGIIVDIEGLRGFMPASLVDRRYVPDLSVFMGEEVEASIIELDKAKRRIVLSRQAVLDETYEANREETWESLEEGQVREGVVQRLTDFGAFVDLGAVDGLVHISELSWGRVEHPSEVVSEGEKIEVKVLSVDRERERVSLSLRQTLSDPWETVDEKFNAGDTVEGKVVRTVSFGAFVELEPGIEGLVHISQLAWRHVENTEEVVNAGDVVQVKILSVNKEEKRISLSIKETTERPERPARRKQNVSHTESGNVTLGDMFGDLLNKAKKKDKEE